MHAEYDHEKEKDISGGVLTTDEKSMPMYDSTSSPSQDEFDDGFEYPTEEEKNTLRHVPYCMLAPSPHLPSLQPDTDVG